ncbi:MAG TPA: 2-oxoacid:ferredoxin oxidoreductase subunit gamma [Firmicutes bacterium]|uniref:2-oxoacid:acceptor oxidoreductase family protein n=1 Tax=Candidatus Fermentithermobacillus carboniphilus TaxID=3085328 RepID=A0AAT9LCT0_9FIRM|nr:MAG: 2-oxoacid:acceptor oxidoreductase family protein [Candidatus Fermentithermobacillus carboniphilus]HHW17947.1 2-oxoacid:ferredoxin oxidoreductase subunit gamma [Candidatus Fermentithermobacillaceae bacterium]
MTHEIIMAGFGGQGIMLIGTLLTYAGMREGKAVSWLPSYGPEMRGGTANCAVCISDEEIASPIVVEPTSAIIMNLPSFEKFHRSIVPGGCLILNSSLVNVENIRGDISVYRVPANDAARELGSERVANMVCLGALLGARDIVNIDTVVRVLPEVIHERHHHLLPINEKALYRGFEMVSEKVGSGR